MRNTAILAVRLLAANVLASGLLAGLILLPVSQAAALVPAARPSAPDPIERVACRMVTQGGMAKRVCDNGAAANANCPLVTRRIVKAGGEVVMKTRRQCG